jgi:hypothetical protein
MVNQLMNLILNSLQKKIGPLFYRKKKIILKIIFYLFYFRINSVIFAIELMLLDPGQESQIHPLTLYEVN